MPSQTFEQRLLALLNEEMKSNYTDLGMAMRAYELGGISYCGVQCDQSCSICQQAKAALDAFYSNEPVEVQQFVAAADEEDEEILRARALDEIEEINRINYEWDYNGHQDDEEASCCSYGLDWNESGYYD